jgi:hypothetical protein
MNVEPTLSQEARRDTALLSELGYVGALNRLLRKAFAVYLIRSVLRDMMTHFGIGIEHVNFVSTWY